MACSPPCPPPLPIRHSTRSHHRELATRHNVPSRSAARPASPRSTAGQPRSWPACRPPLPSISLAGFLVFVALVVVAWNEFRGRRRLLDFDPAGATILGWNQLGLLVMISIYCLWALYSNLVGLELGRSPTRGRSRVECRPRFPGRTRSMEGFDSLYRNIVDRPLRLGNRAQRRLPRRKRALLLHPTKADRGVHPRNAGLGARPRAVDAGGVVELFKRHYSHRCNRPSSMSGSAAGHDFADRLWDGSAC